MEPTLRNTKPNTTVIDEVTALTVTRTIFRDEPILGVTVFINYSEKALPFDLDIPIHTEYILCASLLIGEAVVCRVSPMVSPNEFRYTFVSPMRVVHRKRTMVIVDPEA